MIEFKNSTWLTYDEDIKLLIKNNSNIDSDYKLVLDKGIPIALVLVSKNDTILPCRTSILKLPNRKVRLTTSYKYKIISELIRTFRNEFIFLADSNSLADRLCKDNHMNRYCELYPKLLFRKVV